MEGGIVFGLAAATKGEITIEKGRVVQGNFNTYDVTRMDESPAIDVYIVPSTESPSGAGESYNPTILRGGGQRDLRGDQEARPQAADPHDESGVARTAGRAGRMHRS